MTIRRKNPCSPTKIWEGFCTIAERSGRGDHQPVQVTGDAACDGSTGA
jgi:hypothetical protein